MVLATACLLHPAHIFAAESPLIATNLYPRHTTITSLSSLSNGQMDCDWGFACHDGHPVTASWVFHLRTQDDLHRLSGWAQFGDTRGAGGRMLFALFASRYSGDASNGLPWNVAAFADFRGATLSTGYQDLNRMPRLLPQGMVGNASVQVTRSPGADALAMASWTGSIEVEGVVVYAHHSAAQQRLARRDLIRQMRAAVPAMVL
jgi:hypothetical protein